MSTYQSSQASSNNEFTSQPHFQQEQLEYASSERWAALLSELVTIMQAQTTQFDRLDACFNSINAQFDSIDARLDQLDASFDRLVSGTEQTLAALRNRRELIRQLLERRRRQAQAGQLASQVQDHRVSQATRVGDVPLMLGSGLETVQTRSSRFNNLAGRLNGVDGRSNGIDRRVEDGMRYLDRRSRPLMPRSSLRSAASERRMDTSNRRLDDRMDGIDRRLVAIETNVTTGFERMEDLFNQVFTSLAINTDQQTPQNENGPATGH